MTNKQKYQELCKVEFSIPVFSQPFWLDAVCGEANWDVILYESSGVIIASMPYYLRKIYGIPYSTQPRFTQTLGPWIKYPKDITYGKRLSFDKEVMNALIEQLEKLQVVFFQQNFNFKITNWLPFYWKGYSQLTNYTYRIEDISDVEKNFEDFHESIRNNIRRSLKKNLKVLYDLPAKEFYNLHKNSLQKKGKVISYSFDLFSRIYETVYVNNCGRVIYATDQENNLHSAKLFIYDKNSGYFLMSVIDPDYRMSLSQPLLIYETLKYLSDKTKSYDFEGSMIQSVEESLRKFGTTQTPYFKITKTYTKNPFLKFLISKKLQK